MKTMMLAAACCGPLDCGVLAAFLVATAGLYKLLDKVVI